MQMYVYINDHGDFEFIELEEGQDTHGLVEIDGEEFEVLRGEPF